MSTHVTGLRDSLRAGTIMAWAFGRQRWRMLAIWPLMSLTALSRPPLGWVYLSPGRDAALVVRRLGVWPMFVYMLAACGVSFACAVVLTVVLVVAPGLQVALWFVTAGTLAWVILGAVAALWGRVGSGHSLSEWVLRRQRAVAVTALRV